MRIDAYNQISQIYRTTGEVHTGKVRASKGSDKLEISQFGKDYQIAKQAVAAAPDIREDKVASIKERIASGEYNVSADELAQKLVAKYNTTVY